MFMLFKMASLSLLALLNIVGADAEDLAGGPFGGKSVSGGALGLATPEVVVGVVDCLPDLLGPDEAELELELMPELILKLWLVVGARATVLEAVFGPPFGERTVLPALAAVKVHVKYCSFSEAHTEIIICDCT